MKQAGGSRRISLRSELRLANRIWPNEISEVLKQQFKAIVESHRLSVLSGDLTLISGKWYVTHTGLLRLSARSRCQGIRTQAVREFCDKNAGRWAFRATVFTSKNCHGFVGYGDADPSNVSALVHGAEMRIAETRAVNRALRKAYGIGICSVEELGSLDRPDGAQRKLPAQSSRPNSPNDENHADQNRNGARVRDRLCQLIRQYNLDAELVKAYAIDFCGTKALREATREQIENFVAHLADWAEKDRSALLCQLNSYSRTQERAA
jgi:hypothetical protein